MESRFAMPLHGRGRNKTRLARAIDTHRTGVIKWDPLCKSTIQIYVYGNFEKFPENNKALFGLVI